MKSKTRVITPSGGGCPCGSHSTVVTETVHGCDCGATASKPIIACATPPCPYVPAYPCVTPPCPNALVYPDTEPQGMVDANAIGDKVVNVNDARVQELQRRSMHLQKAEVLHSAALVHSMHGLKNQVRSLEAQVRTNQILTTIGLLTKFRFSVGHLVSSQLISP